GRVGLELRELTTPREPGGAARTSLMREIVVRLTIPDRYVIWVPSAIAVAARAGRSCDLLLSTGPVSAHLVARAIRAGRPWVADCNDLWSLNPHRTNGRLRDAIDVRLERTALAAATRLTTVNDELREELGRRHRQPVTT